MSRRVVAGALLMSALPVVLGLGLVRPEAAETGYSSFGLTGLAAGVRTAGDVGVSGGLVTLETGSGQVAARLDSSPSANVLAAPYEPGPLFRTVVGQGNAGAGTTVFDVPDAEAAFPGTGRGSVGAVPPTSSGPVSGAGGSAEASATTRKAEGSATGSTFSIEGLVDVDGSTSAVSLVVDPDRGTTTATGRTAVGRVSVAGVLELRDVVATAKVTSRGDVHTSEAGVTVGGASVGGMPVAFTDEGLVALGTPVLPGQTVRDLTAQANGLLGGAGIEVRTTEAVRTTSARGASAETGGLAISLATPDLPGGVAANRLQVVVGGVSLTEADERTVADAPVVVDTPVATTPAAPGAPAGELPGTPGTAAVPGTPATGPDAALPAAAPQQQPAVAAPRTVLVAGRRMPATSLLAGFAAWQFLSLSTATLYAFVERRRRLEALA